MSFVNLPELRLDLLFVSRHEVVTQLSASVPQVCTRCSSRWRPGSPSWAGADMTSTSDEPGVPEPTEQQPESHATAPTPRSQRMEGWVRYCEYFHMLDADMQVCCE